MFVGFVLFDAIQELYLQQMLMRNPRPMTLLRGLRNPVFDFNSERRGNL